MKKLTLISLLFLSAVSFAQDKFIEVEVTDTITLKPINFQCNVYVDYDYEEVIAVDEDQEYDPIAAKEKEENKIKEAKRILESKKYKVNPLEDSKLNAWERRRAKAKGFTVFVTSEPEMKKLEEVIKSIDGVEPVVSVLKYADEAKAEEQLIKKLMDKAKARAGVIGLNSGLKPGRILEVKEGKHSGDFNMTEFYTQIAKLGNFGKDTGNYAGSLSKTFVVRFAAE